MFSLPRTELTNDDYVILSCPRSSYILVNVYNGAVLCGVGRSLSGRSGDAVYDSSDLYLAPGSNPIFGGDEIRIRRAESSSNPQVTVQAQLENELPRETSVAGVYSPNYLTVDRNGRVGANFSGAVEAASLSLPTSLDAANPDGDSLITWRNPANRLVTDAWAFAYRQEPRGGFRESSVLMGASINTGLPFKIGQPYIVVTETNDPFNPSAVRAVAGSSHQKKIIDAAGNSEFVQWAMAQFPPTEGVPYKLDFGRRQILNVPGGYQLLVWNFNQPFPTQCLMVMANINYNGSNLSAANQPFASDPMNNSQGSLLINNAAGGTSFGINYIAIGY